MNGTFTAFVKFLSLAVLTGMLYWRDLVALWQVALSFEWIGFTLIIISLVFVSLYQRRKALKALMLISESNNKQGAVFLIFAITLYLFGSYAPYVLWLDLCSLVLFMIAYLTLRLDFRIPRVLFIPFTALLFVIPPPIETRFFGVWNSSLFIASIVIAIFLVYIFKASRWWDSRAGGIEGVKLCPLCQSANMREETFCPHCGRERSPPKPALKKFVITKFLIFLLIVIVLAFVYIPVFSLTDQGAAMALYTAQGAEYGSLLQTPEGWVLESSVRLTDYERAHREDFVIQNTYASKKYAENKSYILLEIGRSRPYLMGYWHLSGWNRTRQENYIVLRKENCTMTVLYWEMRLLFKMDSTYSTKYVGVGILMNLTEPITEEETFNNLAQLREIAMPTIDRWSFLSLWTLHTWTLNEIYNRLKDFSFTIIGIVGVFSFARWARAKHEVVERLAENAFSLPENEAMLLAAVLKMKRKRFIGAELLDFYKRLTKTDVNINRFYGILSKFLRLGLLEEEYVHRKGELIMVWERKLP